MFIFFSGYFNQWKLTVEHCSSRKKFLVDVKRAVRMVAGAKVDAHCWPSDIFQSLMIVYYLYIYVFI